jgi:hypothetical protein
VKLKSKLKTGEKTMPQEIKESKTQLENAKLRRDKKQQRSLELADKLSLGDDLAEKIIDEGHSYSRALEIIQEKWAERDQKHQPSETPSYDSAVEITRDDEVETRREAMADAIIHRHDPKHKVTDASKEFMHMNAMDICQTIGQQMQVLETKGRSKHEIIKRAFHSTGDFTQF